jgi:hypothetical protein
VGKFILIGSHTLQAKKGRQKRVGVFFARVSEIQLNMPNPKVLDNSRTAVIPGTEQYSKDEQKETVYIFKNSTHLLKLKINRSQSNNKMAIKK